MPAVRYCAFAITIASIVGAALFVHALVSNAREGAQRAACFGRLSQLLMALQNYYITHGCLPPAYVQNAGNRMHSWRVITRPYLNDNPVLAYDFQKAWNDPINRLAPSQDYKREQVYRPYACASDQKALAEGLTSYVAVVGSTLWPGKVGWKPRSENGVVSGNNDAIADKEVSSAYGNGQDKIQLIELPDSNIKWTEPRDITVDEAVRLYRERKQGKYRSTHRHLHYITLFGRYDDVASIRDERTFRKMLGDCPGPTSLDNRQSGHENTAH